MGCCKWCARLTKALVLAPESLRFQGSQQFGIDTCMANGPNMYEPDGTQDSTITPSISGTVSLRETTRLQGSGDKSLSSLQSLRCTSQDMRSENHYTSPSLLRTTHESESVGQPGQITTSIESPKVKNPNPMLQNHQRAFHTTFDNQYGHKKRNTKY